ncbi:MAG TPA: hypothetical protein VJH90_00625 [archaeon]|nr:hypothetical protein [archaeon]
MVPGVFAAKSIVFITDNDLVTTACPGLDWPDEVAFCNRIQSLGYDVKVVTDSLVEANSPEFQSRISGATAIVFANLSQKYIEYNSDSNSPYGKFMANLIPYTDSKKQLSILSSTIMNVPIFIPPFYYFETPLPWKTTGENVCSSESDSFSTNRITYISNKTTNPVVIYSGGNKHHARVVEAGGGSVIAQCGSAFNSVVNVTPLQRGVFWGFNDTQYFTDSAWDLFDRAVWTVMGDAGWKVYLSAFPQTVNPGDTGFIIIANVTDERGQYVNTGPITFEMQAGSTTTTGALFKHPSGLWINNTTITPSQDAVISIKTPEAFTTSNSQNVDVGTMSVTIDTETYIPNSPFELKITTDASQPSVGVTIFDYNTFKILFDNFISCSSGICTTTISNFPATGPVLISAAASAGGKLKMISQPTSLSGTVFSNITVYRPTQTAILNLTTTWPADWANLTITKPDKTVIPLGSMTKMSSTKFNTTYAFAAGDPNGTYNLSAMIGFQGYVANITGSIQMIAWEAATSLSKSSFLKNETVNVTLETFNAWSSIAFNYTLDIINPESNNMLSTKGNMTGNATLKTTWAIPSGAKAGTYKLKAFINDTYNRTFYKEVSFSVDELPNVTSPKFVLSPTSLNFVTPLTKKIEKVLTIENSGGGTIGSIIITPSSGIATIIFVKTTLTSLTAGQKKDVSLEVNGANAKEGSYTGTLTISSDAGNKTVDIRIELIGDISALADEKLAEVSSVRDSVAALEELGKDTSDVKNSLDQAEKLFKDAKTSYAAGDYENAKSNYEQALASLQAANDKLSELEQADELEEKPQDTASLVWIMAGIVILAIIAVTAYKYKDRIMEMLGKRGGSEEGKEEYYYPPEEGGEEYRVEYY